MFRVEQGGIAQQRADETLAAVSFFNYFDRVLITVLAQPIAQEFSLSDTQLGLLTGPAFVLVYTVASVVGGLIADRKSRRNLIAASLGIWSVLTAACGLAQTFGQMLLFRLGVGLGEGSVNPAAISMLSDYYPPAKRAFPVSVFHGVGVTGIAGSFLLGSYIASSAGWRMAFVVAGLLGLVVALIAIVVLKEPMRGGHDEGVPETFGLKQTFAIFLMRNRLFLWLALAASFGTYAGLGILQWLPVFFMRSHGLSLTQIGFLFGPAISLGILVGQLSGGQIAGFLARRSLDRPLIWCLFSNLLAIPVYCVALWSSSTPVALGASFVAAAIGTSWAPAFLAGLQNACAPALRATAMGLSNVSQSVIAQALVPFMVGVLSDALSADLGQDSLRVAIAMGLSANAIAAFCFLAARRTMMLPTLRPTSNAESR